MVADSQKRSTDGPPVFPGFRRPNFTAVPNEILDDLIYQLQPSQLKVLLYITRRTKGFGRDSDSISLSQIARGIVTRDGRRLDHGTGLSKATIARVVSALEDQGMIKRNRQFHSNGGSAPTRYALRFRGDPKDREPESHIPMTSLAPPLSQIETGGVSHYETGGVSPVTQPVSHTGDTQYKGLKETLTSSSHEEEVKTDTNEERGADSISSQTTVTLRDTGDGWPSWLEVLTDEQQWTFASPDDWITRMESKGTADELLREAHKAIDWRNDQPANHPRRKPTARLKPFFENWFDNFLQTRNRNGGTQFHEIDRRGVAPASRAAGALDEGFWRFKREREAQRRAERSQQDG